MANHCALRKRKGAARGVRPQGECGDVAEWSKAHAWKVCIGVTLSWVRIPPSPPLFLCKLQPNPKDTRGTKVDGAIHLAGYHGFVEDILNTARQCDVSGQWDLRKAIDC